MKTQRTQRRAFHALDTEEVLLYVEQRIYRKNGDVKYPDKGVFCCPISVSISVSSVLKKEGNGNDIQ